MTFSTHLANQRRQTGILLSCAGHAAIIGVAVLLTLHYGRIRPIYRESRCCTTALYWTGSSAGGAHNPKSAAKQSKRLKPAPTPTPASASPANPSPIPTAQSAQPVPGIAAPQQQATIGTGSGTDNAEPAFPVYYPSPGVTDRSLLPAAEQKIIVDVTISDKGEVTDEKLVQGLGNNLDDLVMKTVKSWRFHPATLNGNNIASVEQLVFPFNRDYPSDEGSNA